MNFKSIWSEKVCKIICFSVFFSLSRFKWTFALVRSNNDEPAKFRVVNTQTDGEVKKRKNELWKVSLRHTLPFLMFHNLSHIVVSSCVVVIVARMFCIMEAFGGHIMPNLQPFLFGVFWRTIQIEIYCWIRNELKYHSNTGTSFNPIRVFFLFVCLFVCSLSIVELESFFYFVSLDANFSLLSSCCTSSGDQPYRYKKPFIYLSKICGIDLHSQ